jgi:hypothetical protein
MFSGMMRTADHKDNVDKDGERSVYFKCSDQEKLIR